MDEGLTFNENSVVVKYDGAVDALTLGTDYSIEKNYTYTGKNGEATATFAVVFESATLESKNFYDAKTVVVTYTADLNEKLSSTQLFATQTVLFTATILIQTLNPVKLHLMYLHTA